ncbi:hypothetical protein QBC43DRAFT_326366 [Cladorrhinum sp. PSN259]|nr:hypothetical protein QBC43DRAFT_326366 [Cladorrhinum sp. PSN259]
MARTPRRQTASQSTLLSPQIKSGARNATPSSTTQDSDGQTEGPKKHISERDHSHTITIAVFGLLVAVVILVVTGIFKALGATVAILAVNTLAEWLTEKRSNISGRRNGQVLVQAMRQGKPPLVSIGASDITDGDLLVLKPGCLVPVNGLLTHAKDESVEFEQPSPTGRSCLVRKYPATKDLQCAGIENIIVTGSRVHKGEGLLWVTSVLTEALLEKPATQDHYLPLALTETPEEEIQDCDSDGDVDLLEDQLPSELRSLRETAEEVESTTAKPKPRKSRRPRRRPRGAGAAVADIEETLPLEPKCAKLNSIASTGLPNFPTTLTPRAVEACPLDCQGDGDLQTDDAKAEAEFNTSDAPLLDRPLKTEIPSQPPSPGQSPATQRALRIQGDLGGIPASGIPDFGSEFNIISQSMVEVNQWLPDNDEDQCLYVLPDGNKKTFQGTITLPFCFEGESEPWLCKFRILRDSIYPLLFGRSFLNETDSMSKRRNRIKEVFISATSAIRRVLYVNQLSSIALSEERILGLINGEPIFGFADTCSDIPIIKRSAARQLGFTILEGPEHTTEVQFIDGSTAWTTGTIKNSKWCFGVTSAPEDTWLIENLHVMDDIPCAMILDTWLLWDSDAFDRYRPDFRYDVDAHRAYRQEQLENDLKTRFGAVCTIQVVEKAIPAPGAYETPEAAKASQLIDAADDEVEMEEQAVLARMVALAQQRQLNAVPVANGAPVANANAALPVERGWRAVFRRGRRRN